MDYRARLQRRIRKLQPIRRLQRRGVQGPWKRTADIGLVTLLDSDDTFQNQVNLATRGIEDDGRSGDHVLPETLNGIMVTADESFDRNITTPWATEGSTGDYFEYRVTYNVKWNPHSNGEEDVEEDLVLEEDVFSEDQARIGEVASSSFDATVSSTDTLLLVERPRVFCVVAGSSRRAPGFRLVSGGRDRRGAGGSAHGRGPDRQPLPILGA